MVNLGFPRGEEGRRYGIKEDTKTLEIGLRLTRLRQGVKVQL